MKAKIRWNAEKTFGAAKLDNGDMVLISVNYTLSRPFLGVLIPAGCTDSLSAKPFDFATEDSLQRHIDRLQQSAA